MKEYGQLDIVVNNAGILDERDWERALDVNLVSVTGVCGIPSWLVYPAEQVIPEAKRLSEK